MAIHKPWDRPFFVLGGAVMTDGFSLNLAEGQFGIFNVSKQTPKGAVAVSAFNGYGNDTLFELRLGNKQKMTRTSSNKMYSSFPFHVKDVVDVRVSAPKKSKMEVDELIIGYNGIDDESSISMLPGEHREIHIELEGKALEFAGAPDGVANIVVPLDTVETYGNCDPAVNECEPVDMLPIITGAVDFLKGYELRGGIKLTDMVEVSPVIELAGLDRTGALTQATFNLTVCDTGDAGALALVQQGVPNAEVKVKNRVGALTTYEVSILQKVGGSVPTAPAPYKQTIASVIKGCEDCPSGYTEVEGGFVYSILLEDGGADKSTAVETLANAVVGTAVKGEGQKEGVGMYTVVLTQKLSDAGFDAFVGANPTAVVNFVGEVQSLCENGTETTINWTPAGTCKFSTVEYGISLPDTKCGESRLNELKEAYPDFNAQEVAGSSKACQRKYTITVPTSVVCDQCDPIFEDIFSSESPADFDGVSWKKTQIQLDGKTGKYGIRLKGKEFKLATGECLRDSVGFVEDSVRIRATGGYVVEKNFFGNGVSLKDEPYTVTYLSHYQPRTHVGGNMLADEESAKTFFTGRLMDYDYMGRILSGNESNIVNLDAQYVDYAITLRRNIYSQGLSQRLEETITYHVMVEVGRHEAVEDVVNALASANGIPGVQAFGK